MASLQILALTIGLFAGILVLLEVGRQLGLHWIRKKWHAPEAAFMGMEGAVFGLLGLMIAFTFSAAAYRFVTRSQMLFEEVRDIASSGHRHDLLPSVLAP